MLAAAAPHNIMKSQLCYLTFFLIHAQQTIAGETASTAISERHGKAFDGSKSSQRVTSRRERLLQQPAGACRVCPVPGSTLREDVVPTINGPLFGDMDEDVDSWTCREWDSYAVAAGESASAISADSRACVDLRDGLMQSCCDGLPPLYSCTTNVRKQIFNEDYLNSVPPIIHGKSMEVNISLEIEDLSIVNYGIDGGAIEVSGVVHRSWIDERLSWNESELGCASVEVSGEELWTPGVYDEVIDAEVVVLADGRVSWTRRGSGIASCETQDSVAKICTLEYKEHQQGYHVKYFSRIIANMTKLTGILAEEYILNEDLSGGVISDINGEGGLYRSVRFHFDPINRSCNICGQGSSTLVNNTIEYVPEIWKEEAGDNIGPGCFEINDFLTKQSVTDDVCEIGRGYYEEVCCDDDASSFECESNIHDAIVEELNTISPPDPSPQEEDSDFQSKDLVDVRLLLDILHIFDIDIKSSTMSLLVAVELNWFDHRLSWEPFIGGCHRVSYRASFDAEITEIWVPEIELLNQVEGIQTLPEAHASVRYDGRVKWRRTGVLKASCALTGLQNFPFDKTGCMLEFGGTRDPLYHRIKYVTGDPEYSNRVRNPSGFQEYEMLIDETTITQDFEDMSGFSNVVIRYQFYFLRATDFYVNGFVLLYILFTYLSFGMFLVDYSMGERLGYGSSILFVIVAQDITMSETTPVASDMLWIYKLSFGSKIFVITGIIQSLVVLHIFSNSHKEKRCNEENGPIDEETRPFVEAEEDEPTDPQDNECAPRSDQVVNASGVRKDSTKESDTHENESVKSAQRSRWEKLSGKCTCFQRWILRHDLVTKATDSRDTVKTKQLKMVDWATFISSFVIYSVFLAIMFAVI